MVANPLKSPIAPFLFWMGVWQLWASAVGEELLLPSPIAVFMALCELLPTPLFWQSMSASLARVGLGLFWGILVGLLLGIATWSNPYAKIYLTPIIQMVQATPVVSFILLLLLWTKRDFVPVYVSAFMVAPIIWANTAKGLEQSDTSLLTFAKAYGYSKWKSFRLISIPAVYPYVLSALESAISLGWKSAVAAEVIALPPFAIGTKISHAKLYLETTHLFAWTAVMILLSAIMGKVILWIVGLLGGGWSGWRSL
ncbi:MAG: ABC transporter permease subunit [Eubacteriales bacterium]